MCTIGGRGGTTTIGGAGLGYTTEGGLFTTTDGGLFVPTLGADGPLGVETAFCVRGRPCGAARQRLTGWLHGQAGAGGEAEPAVETDRVGVLSSRRLAAAA